MTKMISVLMVLGRSGVWGCAEEVRNERLFEIFELERANRILPRFHNRKVCLEKCKKKFIGNDPKEYVRVS
jgi:hypothetical protein